MSDDNILESAGQEPASAPADTPASGETAAPVHEASPAVAADGAPMDSEPLIDPNLPIDVAPPPPERQYCVFRTGGERYCISVLEVEEVVEWPKITPLPLSPSFLLGIFNLRGSVVPVVDVAAGQSSRQESALRRVVVGLLESPDGIGQVPIGIAADEVVGTCTTTEPLSTEGLTPEISHCSGFLRDGEKLAMALDVKRVAEVFPVPGL